MPQKLETTQKIEDKTVICFRSLATDADLICSSPQPDRSGKDFNLEWPDDERDDISDDKRPTRRTCAIQLKGTQNNKFIEIKLKSVEWLVNSPLPAFICAMNVDESFVVNKIFMFHIIGSNLERVLKRLRQSSERNENTAKKKIRLYFSQGQELDIDAQLFRGWLDNEIDKDFLSYVKKKENEKRTSGYRLYRYRHDLQVSATSLQEIREAFIGERPLNVEHIQTFETRFDIELEIEDSSIAVPTSINMEVIEPEPCTLIVYGSKEVRLDGKITGAMYSTEVGSAAKFSADCFKLVIHYEPKNGADHCSSVISLDTDEFLRNEFLPSRAIEILSVFLEFSTENISLKFQRTESETPQLKGTFPKILSDDTRADVNHLLDFYQRVKRIWEEAASNEVPIAYSQETARNVWELSDIIAEDTLQNKDIFTISASQASGNPPEHLNRMLVVKASRIGEAFFGYATLLEIDTITKGDEISLLTKSSKFLDLKYLRTDDIISAFDLYSQNQRDRRGVSLVVIHKLERSETS